MSQTFQSFVVTPPRVKALRVGPEMDRNHLIAVGNEVAVMVSPGDGKTYSLKAFDFLVRVGEQIDVARQGDWIVQHESGDIEIVPSLEFSDRYRRPLAGEVSEA